MINTYLINFSIVFYIGFALRNNNYKEAILGTGLFICFSVLEIMFVFIKFFNITKRAFERMGEYFENKITQYIPNLKKSEKDRLFSLEKEIANLKEKDRIILQLLPFSIAVIAVLLSVGMAIVFWKK